MIRGRESSLRETHSSKEEACWAAACHPSSGGDESARMKTAGVEDLGHFFNLDDA
jgi:hypothetical protein